MAVIPSNVNRFFFKIAVRFCDKFAVDLSSKDCHVEEMSEAK